MLKGCWISPLHGVFKPSVLYNMCTPINDKIKAYFTVDSPSGSTASTIEQGLLQTPHGVTHHFALSCSVLKRGHASTSFTLVLTSPSALVQSHRREISNTVLVIVLSGTSYILQENERFCDGEWLTTSFPQLPWLDGHWNSSLLPKDWQ